MGCLSRMINHLENFPNYSFALYFKGNFASNPIGFEWTLHIESFVFPAVKQTSFTANSIL